MKKNLLPSIILFCTATFLLQTFSFAQNLQWAKAMGGTGSDFGHFITTDASGNVYSTGYFSGTVDFDPGVGVFNLSSAGSVDIFISKLNAAGNFLWAKAMGGTGFDEGYSIDFDASGNVYITGDFQGTVDFDPGAGTFNLISAGIVSIFISKFDSAGNYIWAKAMGGTGGDYGFSIVFDASGNVYTTGIFTGTVDCDPSAGVFNLTSAGSNDIFISKLDASGNFVWAKRLGGTSSDVGYSIVTDAQGNILSTGYFQGTVDFNPGAGVFNLTSVGLQDIFISKLDALGNFIWAKTLGGTSNDEGSSIATDNTGNVFTTGYFGGTADIDPGAGIFNLTSAGMNDIFISKLDSSGNFIWAKRMGGTSQDEGNSIVIDASGNVYTTGYFSGTADFDPSAGTFNLTSATSNDIFISKLDSSGNFVWAKRMGGTGIDSGYSIAIDALGNVYTTGYFNGTSDFDPSAGTFNLTSAGAEDIFVLKMSPLSSLSGTIFKSDSITQITSGKVYLVNNTPGVQFAYVDSFTLNGNGNYSFSNVSSGNYLVEAKPDKSTYPNAIPTYYGDTVFWQGATNLALAADTTSINIRVKEVPPLTGTGLLSGRVQFGIGTGKTGNGIPTPFGDPVPGIDISLDEIPGGIRAHTTTDDSGNYVFPNVPINGTYKIIVDLAAMLMDSTYTRTLNIDNTEFTGLDFVVDTTSGDTGVFVGWSLGISDFRLPTSGFNIFPNPNNGTFTLELRSSVFGLPSFIKIYNVLGEIVFSLPTSDFSEGVRSPSDRLPTIIDLPKQPAGIYNVQVKNGNGIFNKKIVIQ